MVHVRTIQSYLIACCLIGVRGLVSITSEKSQDGQFLFLAQTKETLTCTINPCSGKMSWSINNVEVASCVHSYCTQISTGTGTYNFGFNTRNCKFEMTFNPVTEDLGGSVIECSDGVTSHNITLKIQANAVQNSGASFYGHSANQGWVVAGFILSVAVFVAVFFDLRNNIFNRIKKRCQKKEQSIISKNVSKTQKPLVPSRSQSSAINGR